MRGLEGKGNYSEREKKKNTKRDTRTIQKDTRTPNEVRQQTSVTCVE